MDHMKQHSGGSSFTENLFGPKDASSTSSGLFNSVFGPSSTGIGSDSKSTGSPKKQEYGSASAKPSTQSIDYKTQRMMVDKVGNLVYRNEPAEPSYLGSSIYYGGQEVYSPNTHTHTDRPQHTFKKDGGDDDPTASRGNWWQGSLYY
ncbi:uncharacterized protein LOC143629211 [Bidens hawaiensis]|uniref:uncharacterized protein LOC143629211 n=1 Tax=Bidens hawaiensis TaxID=980011 RepID=UPI00404AE691